jgi:Arc/MetJ family transcription regulator
MRTNIDIDDRLMHEAMRCSGAETKKATVEAALRLLVDLQKQSVAFRKLRGKIQWQGDLKAMRATRFQV